MFPGLKKHFPVYLPVAAGLSVIALLTVLGGLWQYQNELDAKLSAKPAPITAQSVFEHGKADGKHQTKKSATVSPGLSASSSSASESVAYDSMVTPGASVSDGGRTAGSSASGPSGSGYTSEQNSVVSVTLSVNGSIKGGVKLKSGSTQCDVLSQALYQGVISSLDMRYSSQYGTEGVYVIDGVGDPDTVWWTYQINGHAPPYGCGYVTVRDGDRANWQYVKR